MGNRFSAEQNFQHGRRPKIGILVTNLGTPSKPTKTAVKRYLKEFLSDPRVVEIPKLVWWLILNGVILQIRPKRSAAVYQKVWTKEGSPLLTISQNQANELKKQLNQQFSEQQLTEHPHEEAEIELILGMRYGSPSIADGLKKLRGKGCEKLLILPLYPQYSGSTTGSTFDAVSAELRSWRYIPELHFLNQYCDHTAYIEACVTQIQQFWQDNPKPEKLIFSFHGIPKRYLMKGDAYHCYCHKTSRLIAEKLDFPAENIHTFFQSRFGREEWLQPYLDKSLELLAKEGTKHVTIFCPGFSADCLETLEEIDLENRDIFLSSGGEKFDYIPCLNAETHHIAALAEIVTPYIKQWNHDMKKNISKEALTLSKNKAIKLGAET